jgi:hypothetical protein
MGSRTAAWLAWSMCLVAGAAIAGALAVDVTDSSFRSPGRGAYGPSIPQPMRAEVGVRREAARELEPSAWLGQSATVAPAALNDEATRT